MRRVAKNNTNDNINSERSSSEDDDVNSFKL